MSDPDHFELTEADLASALWRRLSAHLEARLEQQRRKNDNDLDPIATAHVRGRLAELRALLARAEPDA